MGIYPGRADVSVARRSRYFGLGHPEFHQSNDTKHRLRFHTNQRGYGHFSHHEVHLGSAPVLSRCGQTRARHFASSVDAARVSEKHSRAQAFAQPSRAVRHPRFSSVCAHRTSVARVARRGFRPVLPGVAISPSNAESHDTGNIPPESARGCRARATLAAVHPGTGSPRVLFRTLPVTPRRNLTPRSPPRPSSQCLSPLAFARRNRSRKRTETRSPRRRSARPSRSFVRPSRYARAPPDTIPTASRAFRARARGRAVRRQRRFARARLAR